MATRGSGWCLPRRIAKLGAEEKITRQQEENIDAAGNSTDKYVEEHHKGNGNTAKPIEVIAVFTCVELLHSSPQTL